MPSIVERFGALPAAALEETLHWRTGSLRDYAALARFHYLRNKPVTATRVIVVEHVGADVAMRFQGMSDFGCLISDWGAGHHGLAAPGMDGHPVLEKGGGSEVSRPSSTTRMAGFGQIRNRIVGVLVESLPALSCRLRDLATDGRYGGWKDRRMAARLLNAEVRCISRVVVHPQWRGLGLAVKLVRHALETMTTPYTEALAAMGRVHPFFKLAGMTEYRRPPLKDRRRLLDALRYCGIEPWELASEERMGRVMGLGRDEGTEGRRDEGEEGRSESDKPQAAESQAASRNPQGALLRRELARWAGRRLTLAEQLDKAREELLCEVVYYLRRNDE
ncbi:MAG: hypothetical protein WC058_05200 [Phycisphaeraceae bacterium]